jgi:hypothetical protein
MEGEQADNQVVVDKLKKLTGCNFVKIVNCGNAAILCALYVVKRFYKKIQIPDQGGWLSYQTFPKIFDLEIEAIKTNSGLITNCDGAVLFCNPAGYFAEQDLKLIRKKAKLMIADVCGSIGKDHGGADIVVGSFGRWKPVDLGAGGFFATNNKDYFKCAQEMFPALKIKLDNDLLLQKLNNLEAKYRFYDFHNRKIKSDLSHLEIVHKIRKGINVVIKYQNENQREEIIQYCSKNGYEYTTCPRYIRLIDTAISIEVKRMSPEIQKNTDESSE